MNFNFCETCKNMLFTQIDVDEEDDSKSSLTYVCKKCNLKTTANINSCVFNVNKNTSNIKKTTYLNKYIYNDNTLPTAVGIKCPNAKCPKPNPNIVYIEYDSQNMKYTYVCLDCYKAGNENHIW